jgi:hypothetical protein
VIGVLYDVAHVIYAASTGRSFWGERIKEDELLLLGACALMSVGLGAAAVVRALKRLAQAKRLFAVILDPGVAEAVTLHADRRVLDSLTMLQGERRRALVEALERYAVGTIDARGVLKHFSDAVSARLATIADEQRALLQVFSEDLRGFRDADLSAGYRRYTGGRKFGQKVLDPIAWAHAQRPGSSYHQILIRELGPEHKQLLSQLIRRPAVRQVDGQVIRVLEKYGHIVDEYGELRRQTEGLGYALEVDHLIEKRFRNSPRWDRVALDDRDIFSLIVARDPQIAAQIPGYRGYVHTGKTTHMNRLIPRGAEDYYTTQQWWDAHIYCYRSLGVDENVLRTRFLDQFHDFVKLSGEKPINYRFNQRPEDFLPENGWPPVSGKKTK